MIRRLRIGVAATTIVFCGAQSATRAEIQETRAVQWGVLTESSQAHPKLHKMAYLVTETFRSSWITLAYSCERSLPLAAEEVPELNAGGTMSARLRIVKEDETIDLGRSKTRCANLDAYWRYCYVDWNFTELELEPGDVILWKVKFRKMPQLRADPGTSQDGFDLVGSIPESRD